MRKRCSTCAILALGPALGLAAGLPDTGQSGCFTASAADTAPAYDATSVSTDTGSAPRQDCRYGRDPAVIANALAKTGAGLRGLDYTKVAKNGTAVAASAPLGAGATDWACTRDNVTGLVWEVKTASNADLRYGGHVYTWYNPDGGTNAGTAGATGSNTCNGTLPAGQCNMTAYISAVNAANLCGFADWRAPTPRELLTLAVYDGSSPSIDTSFFPNTPASNFFTSETSALDPTGAWIVSAGQSAAGNKGNSYALRLVRGGPF